MNDRLAELISSLEPGQTLAVRFSTLQGAREKKREIASWINKEVESGVLRLQLTVTLRKDPAGGGSVLVHCAEPTIVEIMQPTTEGYEITLREEIPL